MNYENAVSYIENNFSLSDEKLKKIVKRFTAEMNQGLRGRESSLKMLPAFIDTPCGSEKGGFLAIDLGGTNLRVLKLELLGNGRIRTAKEKKVEIEKKLIYGKGEALFDFIAGTLGDFIGNKQEIAAGFTFSFPVKQTGVASGILLNWTKGFSATGVVGRDVVKLLNESLARKNLNNIRIAALVNDTVGTLLTGRYKNPECDVAIILGTGTNACYRESLSEIPKWHKPHVSTDKMIVNIEWGNFNKLYSTKYDKIIDRNSQNPGSQVLEKMVSGLYLGEIARQIILDFISHKVFLYRDGIPGVLGTENALRTESMSKIEADKTVNLSGVAQVLAHLGIEKSSYKERALVKRICGLVSNRGALISAAALGAVILKIDPELFDKHTVAVDGSVYEKHPHFSGNMKSGLYRIFGKKSGHIHLSLIKDGSGFGAGMAAASVL